VSRADGITAEIAESAETQVAQVLGGFPGFLVGK
jgi:hypothetical protein